MIVGTHTTRESISLWQLFIPLDDTREEYITNCYNTNTVSIASRNGEVVSDVPIGDLALQQLEFPLEGEFGSHMIVGNVTTEGHEQLVILDVMHRKSVV